MSMSITHIELYSTEITLGEQNGTIGWCRFWDYFTYKYGWVFATFNTWESSSSSEFNGSRSFIRELNPRYQINCLILCEVTLHFTIRTPYGN
jgi:hypothetical protein